MFEHRADAIPCLINWRYYGETKVGTASESD